MTKLVYRVYVPSEKRAVGKVVCWGVMLCAVITPVFRASIPVNSKLLLGDAVAQPVVPEVPRLGFAWDECGVGHANSGGVVALEGRAGLLPTHFGEGLAKRKHFLGADE